MSLQRGHLRLIVKCGLYMYTFVFLSKFSRCGLNSGALNSPEITVTTVVLFFTSECIIVRLSVSYICQRGVLQLHVGAEKSKNQTHSIQSFFNICSIKVIISVVLLCRCTNRR